MKRFYPLIFAISLSLPAAALTVKSPDGKLAVDVELLRGKYPVYSVDYDGSTMLRQSPLGLTTNIGVLGKSKSMTATDLTPVKFDYTLDRIKQSRVETEYNKTVVTFVGVDSLSWSVEFLVGDNDVAFRYIIPKEGDTGSIYIDSEATGFRFPKGTTTFITPQSDPMIGWKRTKPSYEEEYVADAPMDTTSQYGHGYTFPCLFKVADEGWVLISETGVDSHYCASHLSEYQNDGLYTIAYPMPGENNGNGNTGAAQALPAVTPWRTITVGRTLAPIVETTVPWDVVEPLYATGHDYRYGRGTWSWILWQDDSINLDDLKKYVDLAETMGYEYILVDNWWDNNIGRERLPELIEYARSKGIDVFMWYSSSGYWNDIEQGPINHMDNPIVRKREMRWLRDLGVKGIKVDFFGGDKQETMRLYESILSDADDNGLMVIFHGCTLPRGWERMYPNYVGSEAVLASENIYFQQHFCDEEAFNATLHPFIRNTVGSMEFGGTFLNKYMNRDNKKGNVRRTTDAFELATAVLFQNPIQNFALAPNNLTDAPEVCIEFMKQVPTTWDSTRYVDGYPGQFVVLERTHGSTRYIAGVNATPSPMEIELPGLNKGDRVEIIRDSKDGSPVKEILTVGKKAPKVVMQSQGGFVATVF
ncbi:MAG: glycoside hydrolase family 97 catalytic domain-containing protein [Muribaculaceae bacterium]|nr:glycoside hydrolase family 97 catalytic domain-containing protein [Muribaculaceae bacterium]